MAMAQLGVTLVWLLVAGEMGWDRGTGVGGARQRMLLGSPLAMMSGL